MTREDLLKMELHEIIEIPNGKTGDTVMRVSGGWIYRYTGSIYSSSMCFVPEELNTNVKILT